MAKQNLNIIKSWFRTGLKPSQQQFWDTWDSFWHKDSIIPSANIENLDTRFNEKADADAIASHIKDLTAHGLNGKAGLVEDNKFTGKNTFVNNISTPKVLTETGIDFNLDASNKVSHNGFAGKLAFGIEDGGLSLLTTATTQDTASSPVFLDPKLTINNAGDVEINGKMTTAELSVRTAENYHQNIKPAELVTEDTQLLLPALSGTLARTEDLPKISAGANVEITGIYPEVIINASGDGSAGSPLVPITYSELVAATSAGTLVPGQQYLMTDFQSTFVYSQHVINENPEVFDSLYYTSEVYSGAIEPIIVLALTINSLHSTARSTVYPDDEMVYTLQNKYGGIIASTKGTILERKDLVNNNRVNFDFRETKYKKADGSIALAIGRMGKNCTIHMAGGYGEAHPCVINYMSNSTVRAGQAFMINYLIDSILLFEGWGSSIISNNLYLNACTLSAGAIDWRKSTVAYQLMYVTSLYYFTGEGYTINSGNIAYFDMNKEYGPLTIVASGAAGRAPYVQYIDNNGVVQTKRILKNGF